MTTLRLSAALALAALTAACAGPSLGPPAPGRRPQPSANAGPPVFRAGDFAWSQAAGRNSLVGHLAARPGGRLTCSGNAVVLTPETPWSRARMAALYGSTERAALPSAVVRDRSATAPKGDAGPYVKRATCDGADRFSFSGLPDGAWFALVIARPPGQPNAEATALLRRVTTRGGRVTTVEF